eukprot:343033-Pleurochrysis_carterae.AAC.3
MNNGVWGARGAEFYHLLAANPLSRSTHRFWLRQELLYRTFRQTASDTQTHHPNPRMGELSVGKMCILNCVESRDECRKVQYKTDPQMPTYTTYLQN